MRKLKTRLAVAFLLMLIVPVLLISGLVLGFSRYQMYALGQAFGVDVTADDLSSNISLVSSITVEFVTQLQQMTQSEPEAFSDEEWLEAFNTKLDQRYSFLIGRRGSEIYYYGGTQVGSTKQAVIDALPAYGTQAGGENGVYLGGDVQALVKQVDYSGEDETPVSLFVVTPASALTPRIKSVVGDVVMLAILVLAMTSLTMIVWIYTSIKAPLDALKSATNNIKNGNLNFSVTGCEVEELNELCEDFEDMRLRLKSTTEEKMAFDTESKALITNISHDLKTPITAVKGYVEGIMDGVADTPEKMDRYIRTIYAKANEMDRLINELTFYSKIDTNRIPYTFSRLNVVGYFDDCADDLRDELSAAGIQMKYSCLVDRSCYIIADAEQLKRVISNIVSNSVKYMDKEERRVELRIRDVGDFIQVDIEDNGKGIEARNVAYIFERFYRTDASRNSGQGGSGIGLSIVKKIMDDHGGKVWANSVEGEGTTITFVLRKYQEDTDHEQNIDH